MVSIGHNFSEEEIFSRVREHWDLTGLFPLPLFDVKCPECGAGDNDVIIRIITFARKGDSPHTWRANVGLKCTQCSFTWVHGVVIPNEMAKKHHLPERGSASYNWREICQELNIPYGTTPTQSHNKGPESEHGKG